MTKTFRDLGVDPALCDALADGGITHPFPIQELTLPLALEGHDLIGQARTGTGKTLAFGLPLLQRLDPTLDRTQALVIVPTRELCLQVHADLQVGTAKGLSTISVYGGVGYDEQIDALTGGVQVVVGTPGRLLDLLNRGVLDLSNVTQLVLDEADEMLDMGFLPDVERLVEACAGDDRHTMLFSATMPTAIVKLARRYMDHPTFTRADHEQKNTAPLVTQYFFQVHRMDKPRLLARILQSKDRGGVYVFVRTKHMADRLVNDLEDLRVPSIAIHGDLRQTTREKNLDRFRSGQATVLVCTEVAARGLDVSGVTHVVNYDCPDDEKMYLHRIGRTARAGEAGVAITFAEFNEIDRLNVIRKAVGATDSEVEQVFSTSKQLNDLFDLPDERPWDHLSTKAGGDEARAKRESRSDDRRDADEGRGKKGGRGGKKGGRDGDRPGGRSGSTDGRPKSSRASEGRGGDHDARRGPSEPSTRTTAGSSAGESGDTDAGTQASGREANGGEAGGREATSSRKDDETGTATRTRTRTRARSGGRTGTSADAGSGSGSEEAPRSGSTDDDTQGAGDTERTGRGAGNDDATAARPRARQRARGGQPRDDASRTASSGPASSEGGSSSSDGGRAGSPEGADAGSSEGASSQDAGTGDRGSSERSGRGSGRSRGAGRSKRSSSSRSRGSSSKDTDDGGGGRARSAQADGDDRTDGSNGGSDGSNGAGDRSRSGGDRGRGGRRGGRGSGGSRSGGNARGGGNTRGGGGRSRGGSGGGNAPSGETVKVAERGADARGDGQPQPARRVRVEHLP